MRVHLVTPFGVPDLDSVIEVPLVQPRTEPAGPRIEVPATGLRSIPRRILPKRTMAALRQWKDVPDFDRHWAERARQAVQRKGVRADWLITTSPPESVHGVGRELANSCGARWCAELRDSWVDDSHRAHVRGVRALVEERLARRWLGKADALTAVDPLIAGEAARLTSGRVPVIEIPHFSDPPVATNGPRLEIGSDLALLHSGGFTLSDRKRRLDTLLAVLDPVHHARRAQGLGGIRLHITGRLSQSEAELAAMRADGDSPGCAVHAHGPVSLAQSRALQQRADALLLFIPDGSRALPGKFAEYALSGRPIFYVGPPHMRLRANRPDMLQPVEALATASVGDSGPVDEFYDALANARALNDALSAL